MVIPVPKGYFLYQAPNDFGLEIRKILLIRDATEKEIIEAKGNPNLAGDVRATHLNANMREVCKQLGIEVIATAHCYYPRDHLIPSEGNGLIGSPSGLSDSEVSPDQIQIAIERGFSWSIHRELRADCHTSHLSFGGMVGSTLKSAHQSIDDYQEIFKKNRPEGRVYLEGGNVYTITDSKGKRRVLLGASQLGINLALGHIGKIFKELIELNEKHHGSVSFPSNFSNAEIFELIQDKYALGRIKIGGSMGVISPVATGMLHEQMQKAGKESTLKTLAIKNKLIKPLPFKPTQDLQKHAPSVARFAYEGSLATDLLAKTLGVTSSDLHFIPQAGYHLDTFMRPGPKGTMLVQSYGMVELFLDTLKRHTDLFQLTKKDEVILQRYSQTADQLQSDLGPLLKQVSQTIQGAGLTVLPVPAIFYDEALELKGETTFHVNFINGVSGYSPLKKAYYYLTTGAQVGDNLGTALMDLFSWYMQELEPNLEVYFVGRHPTNSKDFSEVMKYWNRPGTLASNSGLHCMTMELETEPHMYIDGKAK